MDNGVKDRRSQKPENSKRSCLANIHLEDQLATGHIHMAKTLTILGTGRRQTLYRMRVSMNTFVLPYLQGYRYHGWTNQNGLVTPSWVQRINNLKTCFEHGNALYASSGRYAGRQQDAISRGLRCSRRARYGILHVNL